MGCLIPKRSTPKKASSLSTESPPPSSPGQASLPPPPSSSEAGGLEIVRPGSDAHTHARTQGAAKIKSFPWKPQQTRAEIQPCAPRAADNWAPVNPRLAAGSGVAKRENTSKGKKEKNLFLGYLYQRRSRPRACSGGRFAQRGVPIPADGSRKRAEERGQARI